MMMYLKTELKKFVKRLDQAAQEAFWDATKQFFKIAMLAFYLTVFLSLPISLLLKILIEFL